MYHCLSVTAFISLRLWKKMYPGLHWKVPWSIRKLLEHYILQDVFKSFISYQYVYRKPSYSLKFHSSVCHASDLSICSRSMQLAFKLLWILTNRMSSGLFPEAIWHETGYIHGIKFSYSFKAGDCMQTALWEQFSASVDSHVMPGNCLGVWLLAHVKSMKRIPLKIL